MQCTKAIILAGGVGTRWLPLAKALQKEMVPIGDKPLIDWIADDLIKAGIKDIIFRVAPGVQQIKMYYSRDPVLEDYLQKAGKDEQLAQIKHIASKATYHYSARKQAYGTAVAVWDCRQFVNEGEKVLVVSGDQLIYNPGGSAAADFLQEASKAGTPSAMMVVPVPKQEVSKYGIVKYREQNGVKLFDSIIEKPSVDQAPSNLNNATFFLFDQKIFGYANPEKLPSRNNEYYITDALNNYVRDGNQLAVIQTLSEYLDCGTIQGWLHANNRIFGPS